MRRRDFLRLVAVGTCGAAGLASAGTVEEMRGVALAHTGIVAADRDVIELAVTEHALRASEISRAEVDAHDFLAEFGMWPREVGVTQERVTVVRTELPDALAEWIETGDRRLVIWDGVVYELEGAS